MRWKHLQPRRRGANLVHKIPFYLLSRENALNFTDYPDNLVDLISDQAIVDEHEQSFSEALQADWDDTDTRLDVFGPDFTEETLKDTLDLCEAVEFMNKGYIL